MNFAQVLESIGNAIRLFIETIPDAFWLTYYWVKDWQSLVGALILVLAARIFSQGALRAARIRATGMIRAAQITAGVPIPQEARPVPAAVPAPKPEPVRPPVSAETDLIQRVEQLRSLIRSAMSTLTADTGQSEASPNYFCGRIAQLNFEANTVPPDAPPLVREPYEKLLAQLAVVRDATERKAPHAEMSQALVQLNARAREFAAVLAPFASQVSVRTRVAGA
ncbi:MAG TPA: hypothetical protein VMU22_02385 [Rhizomicrobium sp.]|nr:hypothetical protein [Rhizomicrobium sp.]